MNSNLCSRLLRYCGGGFDVAGKAEQIEILEAQSAAPGFWDDGDNAQKVMRDITRLRSQVDTWQKVAERVDDALLLAEMDDPDITEELGPEVTALSAEVNALQLQTLFSGQYDDRAAILAIHAGAGGTEAQDWADMLLRMITRWSDANEMRFDMLDFSPGDVTGVKSVTLQIDGDYAFGRLRSEKGVHRLVRISPYDSSARRHTSFAKMEVWPDIAEEIEIEIDDKELRIDRFKASGAGGQHVQKNETAIRITHGPTGIVVSSQSQRSLTQNMEAAMKILKTQLYELEQQKQAAELADLKGDSVDAGWGNQIRSYVMHPYKMVKDHRTKHETGNVQGVLDGDLNSFMEAFLRFQLDEQEETA